MAAKPLPERAKALAGKLGAALPFLKPRVPAPARVKEPFDTIEDGSSAATDDFGPNAAPDLEPAKAKDSARRRALRGGQAEALKGIFDSIIRSKLALSVLFSVLILILAFCVVAITVGAPPKVEAPGKAATAEGSAMLRRLILPPLPGIDAHVELEREKDRVYTDEDASRFLTDPASVDISGLEARNQAEIDKLYRAVP